MKLVLLEGLLWDQNGVGRPDRSRVPQADMALHCWHIPSWPSEVLVCHGPALAARGAMRGMGEVALKKGFCKRISNVSSTFVEQFWCPSCIHVVFRKVFGNKMLIILHGEKTEMLYCLSWFGSVSAADIWTWLHFPSTWLRASPGDISHACSPVLCPPTSRLPPSQEVLVPLKQLSVSAHESTDRWRLKAMKKTVLPWRSNPSASYHVSLLLLTQELTPWIPLEDEFP